MPVACPICQHPNRDAAQFCAACAAPILLGGRFQIEGIVGRGGMGCVYRACDLRLTGKTWAVKEMTDAGITDPTEKQRAIAGFQRESQLLASLNHPNIPRVIDSFQQGHRHYSVTEFVDGSTLHDLLQFRGRPFTEAEVRPWLEELCGALTYLHTRQPPIIYRDLKPQNLMIDRAGHIQLIDFGIARSFQPGKAKDTTLLGTPGYAAPEQHGQSQTDVRSDVYALGVTFYQLLTGYDPTQNPYNLPPLSTLAPALSPEMQQLITRAIEYRPQDRWQSVSDLQASLRRRTAGPNYSPAPPPAATAAGQTQLWPYQGAQTQSAAQVRPTLRPTTRLLMAVATLTNRQLAVVLSLAVLIVVLGVWMFAPILQRDAPIIFNNIPLFIIAGPLAYAALRRRGVAFVAQLAVTLASWLTWWLRSGGMVTTVTSFMLATLACSLVAEGGMYFLPRIKRAARGDPWVRELVWFALMAALAEAAFYGLLMSPVSLMPPGLWLGSALVGAAGWFVGDVIQQWLYLRAHGVRRLAQP